MLAERLRAFGLGVVITREPGGSPGAEAIRHVLLSGAAQPLGSHAEAILFAAARDDHVRQLIRPALEGGRWVVCDRFADSTRIYQGVLGNVDPRVIRSLERITVGDTRPDLTFILDVPAEIGLARAAARRGRASVDRFEAETIEFHSKLREAYRELAEREPDRCVLIDANVERRDGRRRDLGGRQPPSRPVLGAVDHRRGAQLSRGSEEPEEAAPFRIRARRRRSSGTRTRERTLLDAYRSGRIPHAWLIGGPSGIGKATLAYRMARFVLAHPEASAPRGARGAVARDRSRATRRRGRSPARRIPISWCSSGPRTKTACCAPSSRSNRWPARCRSSARPRAPAAGASASSIRPTN